MKKYHSIFKEQENIEQKIVEFFSKNSNPTDEQVHSFANQEKIDEHKFEEIIYSILGSFFNKGLSSTYKGEYDPEELQKGIKIEMEHTSNSFIATKIAKDHLAEMKDYYTKLATIEGEG